MHGEYYQGWRDKQYSKKFDEFQDGLDYLGTIPVIGEPVDFTNAGISTLRGNYSGAALSLAAMVPVLGIASTTIKQSHHLVPKAVFKEFKKDLSKIMKRDGIKNLMSLPVPFHGNHPQYNIYVGKAIGDLKSRGALSSGSIESLQGNLRGMIDEALESGEKLNEYFRKFNP
ncbi:AHH domain-containing protein [Flavobacterium hydatis]|uniref:Uncharacterized protein n=1 Tax=Flavobacterium hydatis TaxID=991 RepID=A0ABX4CMS9_FLAHY|nr:AHH domain-containing protein [Flavobacterium hydatis]OXA97799.1 hypothetical protein B0A62_02785 [Flavobacterium hydatis]